MTPTNYESPAQGTPRQHLTSFIWWPGLDWDLKNLVKDCDKYLTQYSLPQPPPQPRECPAAPWEHLHADCCSSCLLQMARSHSSLSSHMQLLPPLRIIFATHGLHCVLVTNNGLQFPSAKSQTFVKGNGKSLHTILV